MSIIIPLLGGVPFYSEEGDFYVFKKVILKK
jgi:hypothetical protein